MPTGLETLLGLNSYTNQTPKTYTPNVKRNEATVGALRNYFGLKGPDTGDISQQDYEDAYGDIAAQEAERQREEAQAKAYVEQIKGQYGLEGERIKAQTARANAEEVMNRAEAERQFRASEGEKNREAISGRQQFAQAQTNQRASGMENGRNYRQQVAQANANAGLYESDKRNAPVDRSLSNFFGMWPGTQHAANVAEAQKIRAGVMQQAQTEPSGDSALQGIAQQYATAYGGMSPESLMGIIQQTQADASPEEQQALLQAVLSLQEQP